MRMLKILKLISNREDRRVFEVFSSPAVVCAVFRKIVKS